VQPPKCVKPQSDLICPRRSSTSAASLGGSTRHVWSLPGFGARFFHHPFACARHYGSVAAVAGLPQRQSVAAGLDRHRRQPGGRLYLLEHRKKGRRGGTATVGSGAHLEANCGLGQAASHSGRLSSGNFAPSRAAIAVYSGLGCVGCCAKAVSSGVRSRADVALFVRCVAGGAVRKAHRYCVVRNAGEMVDAADVGVWDCDGLRDMPGSLEARSKHGSGFGFKKQTDSV